MATLKITELKCVKKQDSISKDEVRIDVDDIRGFSGPHTMKKKQALRLSATHTFAGCARIKLYEEDKNSRDDYLGDHTIKEEEAGLGTRVAHFNERTKADYHIKYYVTA